MIDLSYLDVDFNKLEVNIRLQEASKPKHYENVINVYTKGNLLCVYFIDEFEKKTVHKYPLMNIFRVEEGYE